MSFFKTFYRHFLVVMAMLAAFSLAGCGGGSGGTATNTATYTISGTVSGLPANGLVTLVNNTNDSLPVSADGDGNASFTFTNPVAYGGSYNVTVSTQSPVSYTCSISNNTGAGTNVTANVTSVTVVCSQNTYTIGGTVTGLPSGGSVSLNDNTNDPLTVKANGSGSDSFTFNNPVAYGGSYSVVVSSQSPVGYTCSIRNNTGTGTDITADVTSVAVACSKNTYKIGGTITGLPASSSVTLNNNTKDSLTVSGNGSGTDRFNFIKNVAYGGSYNIVVSSQSPVDYTCSIRNNTGAGTDVKANVTSVAIVCSQQAYTIGGTVVGLPASASVTLNNNTNDSKTVTSNGSFTFSKPVAAGGSYNIAVSQGPVGYKCFVDDASFTNELPSVGINVIQNVTRVRVACANISSPSTSILSSPLPVTKEDDPINFTGYRYGLNNSRVPYEGQFIEDGGIRMVIGKTIRLTPRPISSEDPFLQGKKLSNGDLVLNTMLSYGRARDYDLSPKEDGDVDGTNGGRVTAYRSKDAGQTWQQSHSLVTSDTAGSMTGKTVATTGGRSALLSDGTLLNYEGKMVLQSPDGATQQSYKPNSTLGYARSLIQLKDGRVMTAYQKPRTTAIDNKAEPGTPVSIAFKISSDLGRTWTDFGGVGFADSPTDAMEPYLFRAANGDLLVISNHTTVANRSGEKRATVAVVRSTDEGETWSQPIYVGGGSAMPVGTTLGNGISVAFTGRGCNCVSASRDNGLSWYFQKNIMSTVQSPNFSGHNSVLAVGPSTALLIYSERHSGPGKVSSETIGTFVTFRPIP
jgi:BNR repeat-like domain